MPQKKLKESIKLLMIAIAAALAVGTVMFHFLEGWSYIDSFYFVSMTATTVGYGDFTPTHTLSKIITVVYSLAIIPLIIYAFSVIAKYEVERVYRQVHGIARKQQEQEEEIEKTERKVRIQKHILKEQEEELKKQEGELKKQKNINKEQEEELEGHQKKIKNVVKEVKEQEEELEIVEDIVEDVLADERDEIKKDLKGGEKK